MIRRQVALRRGSSAPRLKFSAHSWVVSNWEAHIGLDYILYCYIIYHRLDIMYNNMFYHIP